MAFINATTNGRYDFIDYAQQVTVILEADCGQLQLTKPLHKNLMRAVNQNIVNRVILQKRF